MTSYFYILQLPHQTSPAICLLKFPLWQSVRFGYFRGGRLRLSGQSNRQLSSAGQDDLVVVRS